MSPDTAEQDERPSASALVAHLQAGYLAGHVADTPALAALTLDDGLALQLKVLDALIASGETLGGWKVGMTSGPSYDRMGVGFRPFGYILERRIFESGAAIPLAPAGPQGIEPELCFRIERRLFGAVSADEVRAAVSGAIPSFELLAFRLGDGAPNGAAIADDLTHWGLVLGEESGWKGNVADMQVDLHRDGERVAKVGPQFNIDDPFESIAALCRQLARFGRGLNPGEHVITGAFHKTAIAPGSWLAAFDGLGTVSAVAR